MKFSADPTSILEPTVPPPPRTPSREELELLEHVNTKLQDAQEQRRDYDMEIENNRAWLEGISMLARDVSSGQTTRIKLSPESRNRFVLDNILRPNSRALLGKHTRQIPTFQAVPASADQADVRAAEIQTSYLDHWNKKERWRLKWVKAHRLSTGAEGTGIWQLYWDGQAGQKISFCDQCETEFDESEAGQPCVLCKQQMEAQIQQQMAPQIQFAQMNGMPPPEMPPVEPPTLIATRTGDLKVRVIDPRYCYPEPGIDEIPDMRYFITKEPVAISTIRNTFPGMGIYVTADNSVMWDAPSSAVRQRQTATSRTDSAWLITYHERPSRLFPEGRLIVCTRDTWLNPVKNPDGTLGFEPHPQSELDALPFYAARWERRIGLFWGESPITQSWHIQGERNRRLRQVRDQADMTLAPMLLTPIQSRISTTDTYGAHPGKLIKYNPMHGGTQGTRFLEAPALPPYVMDDIDRMDRSVQRQHSITDAELGTAPAEQSGRHAAITEASASETIRPFVIETVEEVARMSGDVLKIVKRRLSDRYIWVVHGRDKVWSYDWAAANRGCISDVELVEADSLSSNPAIRLDQCERLLQDGYFTDPETGIVDMEWFSRLAGIKDSRQGPDFKGSDTAYAAALPDQIWEQTWTGPKPWDDAKICAQVLGGWLKGEGRSRPEQHQWMVGKAWMLYAAIFKDGYDAAMAAQKGGAPAGASGQTNSPPGEGPGAGQLPSQGQTPGQEAREITQEADQQGERMARGSQKHES